MKMLSPANRNNRNWSEGEQAFLSKISIPVIKIFGPLWNLSNFPRGSIGFRSLTEKHYTSNADVIGF